jgi:hypothetical protein
LAQKVLTKISFEQVSLDVDQSIKSQLKLPDKVTIHTDFGDSVLDLNQLNIQLDKNAIESFGKGSDFLI